MTDEVRMDSVKTSGMIGLLCLSAAAAMSAQQVEFRVHNPTDTFRTNEPVVIPWSEVVGVIPEVAWGTLRLVGEDGRSLAMQIDDLDADGTPDELVFTTDIAPLQEQRFVLTASADTLPSSTGPFRTDAVNYKRIGGVSKSTDDDDGPGTLRSQSSYSFDGVGWESEVIGYRLYLDERNALDIQGKRIPGLHWDYIGRTGVNYQLDAYWGMDVLHVGSALGIGGIGLWVHETVVHPVELNRRRTRVIARGPVRAVVRVDYDGWNTSGGIVNLTSLFMILGGDRITEHRILLRSGSPQTIAVGMVRHPSAKASWDPHLAVLWTEGPQSRTGDSLFLALNFDRKTVVSTTGDQSNHLVLLRAEPGKLLRYLISAVWEGEGERWKKDTGRTFLQAAGRRLHEPLNVAVANPERP